MNDFIPAGAMNGFVDAHMHLLCWKDLPDSYLKTRAPIREALLRRKYTKWLANFITWLWPGKKFQYIADLFDYLNHDVLWQSDRMLEEMKTANIYLGIVNMMDLGMSSFGDKPENLWSQQILNMQEVARKHYGIIMPFVHMDPRRQRSLELTVDALENKGFLGVKMYPPLGWNPDPLDSQPKGCPVLMARSLKLFYDYAQKNNIPITVHCSRGGAYSDKTMHDKELRHYLTSPMRWARVLGIWPNLRLNFAHMGQDITEPVVATDGTWPPDTWASNILWLCRTYDNVYTDLAYNDQAHDDDISKKYFDRLCAQGTLALKSIMSGSDFFMMRHTWKLDEWYKPFIDNIPCAFFGDIFRDNALRFLFADLKMPVRVQKAMGKTAKDTPEFLKIHFKRLRKERKDSQGGWSSQARSQRT